MPTISEIQDYLEKNHSTDLEDPIKDNSKSRVTWEQAKAIKKNKPMPKGQCHLCSRPSERLAPVTMRVCFTCAGKFMKRGGELHVLQKIPGEYTCDNCFARAFVTLYINPNICQYCARKIGRMHKYHTDEKRETEQAIQRSKEARTNHE